MNWVVRKWYIFSGIFGALVFIFFSYRRRIKALHHLLSSLTADPALLKKVSSRVKQYIPPFLLIEFYYSRVSGLPLSNTQLHKSVVLNGLTPLFDDLVDEQSWDTDALKKVFTSPDQQHLTGKALTCGHLFQQGGFVWNDYWEAVFQAQIDSKKQLGKVRLSENELSAITFQKGAASVVLGWHIIGEESGGAAMKNLADRFGAYAQLVNDIFDIWKDREAEVQTLATTMKNIHELAELHRGIQLEVTLAIGDLPVSTSRKRRLVGSLAPLFCLADLAVERLEQLQMQYGGNFRIEKYSRKELVCDMAKWSNRFRWVWLMLAQK